MRTKHLLGLMILLLQLVGFALPAWAAPLSKLSSPGRRSPVPFPVIQGLVSWWRAIPGLTGSTRWYDLRQSNHCTLTNMDFSSTSGWNVHTRRGGVAHLAFDGSNDYVDCGTGASLADLRTKTVMAWIKPNSCGGSNLGRILDKRSSGGWTMYIYQNGGTTNAGVELNQDWSTTPGTWSMEDLWLGTCSSGGAWAHIAIVYDSTTTSNDPLMYFNGFPHAVLESSSPVGTYSTDASSSLKIGERGAGDRGFDGGIDDVRLYNRLLSAAEIQAIYQESLTGDLTLFPSPMFVFAPFGGPQGSFLPFFAH